MSDLLPFSAFGLRPSAARPTRVGVRVAPEDVVLGNAGGFVTSGETFRFGDDGALEAAEEGLHDEDTFGALPREGAGVDLSAYTADSLAGRPQVRRFGTLALPAPVLHPWVRRFQSDALVAAAGVDTATIDALLDGRLGLAADHALVPASDAGATLGAAALARLAERGGRSLVGLLTLLPVLPAGLRPASLRGDDLLVHDHTALYQRVIAAAHAVEAAAEPDAAPGARARAGADLQRHVEALFLDGLSDAGDLLPPGALPAIRPLATFRAGLFSEECLADLAAVTDAASLVAVLRGPLFLWRALVEASCLEVVPLREDGTVDEPARAKGLADRAANVFDAVYTACFAERIGPTVAHGPDDTAGPHVDVYTVLPAAPDGVSVLLTAGLSTRATPFAEANDAGRWRFELACFAAPGLDPADHSRLARELVTLALRPFLDPTYVLAPDGGARLVDPWFASVGFRMWALFELDALWARRLTWSLPRHPDWILAVPVTLAEAQLGAAEGPEALFSSLEAAGALAFRPGRVT